MSERTPNEIRSALERALCEAASCLPREEVELIVETVYAPKSAPTEPDGTEFNL